MIVVDDREPKDIVNMLKVKKVNVKTDRIEVGDYLLPNGFAIERKEDDLIQSILSNRLYDQLNNLCQYEHPVLAIIINNLYRTFYYSHSRYIHKSYIGTLSTLTAKYPNLKLVFFENQNDFINYLVSLEKKLTEDKESTRPAPIKRKGKSINIKKENALTAIDGISVGKAKKLLECYGSIKNIANDSVENLEKAPGVGKKLAKNIHEVLN